MGFTLWTKPKHHNNISVLLFKRKFVSRICALIKLECLLVAHLFLKLWEEVFSFSSFPTWFCLGKLIKSHFLTVISHPVFSRHDGCKWKVTTEGVAKMSLLYLLYGLMIISHGIYWERLFIILYATKIVWFCSEPTKLLFQLDICCSLFHYKIFGHLDSISVSRVRSHGRSSKALLGWKLYCYCLA